MKLKTFSNSEEFTKTGDSCHTRKIVGQLQKENYGEKVFGSLDTDGTNTEETENDARKNFIIWIPT